MPRVTEIGPCYGYYGDPTAGSGAMVNLGDLENVTVSANQGYTFSSSALLAGAPDHDTIRKMPAQPVLNMECGDWTKAKIEALNVLGTTTSTVIGFGSSYASVAPGTMFVLPADELANGVSSTRGIWVPSATPVIGDFARFGRPTRNGETGPAFFNVQVFAAKRTQDQTSPTPVAIPADFQLMFYGAPDDIGLTWTIA